MEAQSGDWQARIESGNWPQAKGLILTARIIAGIRTSGIDCGHALLSAQSHKIYSTTITRRRDGCHRLRSSALLIISRFYFVEYGCRLTGHQWGHKSSG
jgi:hypothetical protein